jgi:hypothetical protein
MVLDSVLPVPGADKLNLLKVQRCTVLKTILVLYVWCGMLLTVVAWPLLLGKIPPNPVYGFRLSPALDDPTIWYRTSTHSARRLIVVGACTIIAAIALIFVPGLTIDTYALDCLGIFLVVLIVGPVQSVRYMNSPARGRNAG